MRKINYNILGSVVLGVLTTTIGIVRLKKERKQEYSEDQFPMYISTCDIENHVSDICVPEKESCSKEIQSTETVNENIYSKMSVKELRRIASIQKVKNYSKLKKGELLRALQFYESECV